MSDEPIDPGRMTFINNNGLPLGEYDTADLDKTVRLLVAELLEHTDNEDYVTDLLAGFSLLEGVPTEMMFGNALRILTVEILGNIQRSAPTMRGALAVAAKLYRDSANR